MQKEKLENLFEKHYKKFLIIPVILLIFSISVISYQYSKYGDFAQKDISLTGGTSISIYTEKPIDASVLENQLKKEFSKSDIIVRKITEFSTGKQIGIITEVSDVKSGILKEKLSKILNIELTIENSSIEETGSSLGKAFYKNMVVALIFAFLLMAITIFIIFRSFIPSIAVVLCAFLDILTTLAIMNLLGIKLSTGGIAAFLMLIGYSVDTDILLTTRVLKRKEGSVFERIIESFKTGITMTLTTSTVVLVGYIISPSLILKQIFLILFIGTLVDIVQTWLTNTSILYWYTKKKAR
jgi:preprotein translocase subunit SecF